ncbi:MAG: aspartate-semialdehyde dehydrogenase [Chlamydiia bacterium]|nr:aspartate-semialdehyde dehydrogenase [Chlamydiia bacterium]
MVKVGLLGGSGVVGQTYQTLIENHPNFDLVFLPDREEIKNVDQATGCELIFSALPSAVAQEVDPLYAEAGFPVFSSASCHRMERDIPLIIPEINAHHFEWIFKQQERRGWKGFIVAKPNCTLQGMILPLFPLHERFGLQGISVTYLQARSGAGRGFTLEDNILPYIEGEEEKSVRETRKILGDEALAISVQSFRVPVPHGHVASVSAQFKKKPTLAEVRELWEAFAPIHYLEEENRPQPALDLQEGMQIAVGRLRSCPLMDIRFVSLSHNLVRGAAGGGILTADYWRKYVRAPASV